MAVFTSTGSCRLASVQRRGITMRNWNLELVMAYSVGILLFLTGNVTVLPSVSCRSSCLGK